MIPAIVRDVARRIGGLLRRREVDARLDEEIRFHLDMETEKNVRFGMPPERARRTALLRFGGRERWKEAARDEYRSRPLEDLAMDARYAFRTLRNAPAFTVTAVLTLAVGIGTNTAIFSAVDGVLFKPLPFANADRIVTLSQVDARRPLEPYAVAPANFIDFKARARSFTTLAAAEPYSVALDGPDGPENIRNWNVSEGFFDVLGVKAYIGRLFVAGDFVPGRERVVVLSYEGWQRRFGGDGAVVGRAIRLERAPAIVVGVLPPNVFYPAGREMWSPKVFDEDDRATRGSAYYQVIGRLAPGITASRATAELRVIAAQLAREYPQTNADVTVAIVPIWEHLVGHVRPAMLLLLGAVGMVLLIACANVANLLLARATHRGREFAIRAALGAGRWRLIRQLLAESLLLALVSTAAGVALAHWCAAAIRALSPSTIPRIGEMTVDGRALLFALAAAAVTTGLAGLAPSLRAARADLQDELRAGGRTLAVAGGRRGARHLLVAGEVALAVLLLVGAGLLARSFITLLKVDRGYRSDHVLTASVFIWQWNEQPAQRVNFVGETVRRLGALPGVVAAGATSALPIPERIGPDQGQVMIEGRVSAPGDELGAHVSIVTPGAFDVLRIPLRMGRLFTSTDDAAHVPVALINEAMARLYWPGETPLGRRLLLRFGRFGAKPELREIVGVVGDVRQSGLEMAPRPALFIPHAQFPTGSITLIVRTAGDPAAALPALRATLASLNRELPIATGATLDALLADTLKPRRFGLLLLGSFSITALVLAVVGVYGLIAQSAAERTREIGVRIALGARTADVLGLVMRQGLAPAVLGVVVGVAAAVAFTRVLRGMLYDVTPLDGTTFLLAPALMLATAIVACWLPAWRASHVDPLVALRGDT